VNLDIARAINTVIVLHLCKCNSDHPMRTKIFIIARSQTRHGAMLPCRRTLRFVLHSRLSHPNEVHAMADETLTITIGQELISEIDGDRIAGAKSETPLEREEAVPRLVKGAMMRLSKSACANSPRNCERWISVRKSGASSCSWRATLILLRPTQRVATRNRPISE
jgi:hypothetical protein